MNGLERVEKLFTDYEKREEEAKKKLDRAIMISSGMIGATIGGIKGYRYYKKKKEKENKERLEEEV